MAYKHYAEAADSMAKLESGMERYIYLEACSRADRRGIIRMPQSEMAEITLVSPRTIAQVFSALEKRHLISRIGHGRYEIVTPSQSPEIVGLVEQLRQWINKRDNEAIEEGQFNIFAHEESTLPEFFADAVTQGLLKIIERGKVLLSRDESEAFTTYSIHF